MMNKKVELTKTELLYILSGLEELCEDDYIEEDELNTLHKIIDKLERELPRERRGSDLCVR